MKQDNSKLTRIVDNAIKIMLLAVVILVTCTALAAGVAIGALFYHLATGGA